MNKQETNVNELKTIKIYVPITKKVEEQQIVSGVVLEPEQVDLQGDIYDADVISKAAYKFLSQYNKSTELGYMHSEFNKNFELYESYLAPVDFLMGEQFVKKGSWIMTVKVNDADIWESVKKGNIAGFSIGGKARVLNLEAGTND